MRIATLVVLVGVCGSAARGGAEARPERVVVGVGGWNDPIHTEFGLWAGGEAWPARRWGGRVDLFLVDASSPARVVASVAHILGDARPHLVVHLRGGLGWSFGEEAFVAAAGLAGRLGHRALGPLRLGLDGMLMLAGDRLHLVSTLSVDLAW